MIYDNAILSTLAIVLNYMLLMTTNTFFFFFEKSIEILNKNTKKYIQNAYLNIFLSI